MSIQGKNPAAKAYPKVGANSTLGGESNRGRTVQAQPGIKDVNAKQGPRSGNAGDVAKRSAFKANKAEAAPLAKVINDAYGARKIRDNVDPKLEGISPDTKPRSRSR